MCSPWVTSGQSSILFLASLYFLGSILKIIKDFKIYLIQVNMASGTGTGDGGGNGNPVELIPGIFDLPEGYGKQS